MSKFVCLLMIFSLIFSSCKRSITDADRIQQNCDCEKAKAILWIDKDKVEGMSQYPLRTVKVYANVYSDGTLRVISFCKKQSFKVEEYIKNGAGSATNKYNRKGV